MAAGNLLGLGAGNVQLAQGKLDNLPLADDCVDVAVANMVLHHAPEQVVSKISVGVTATIGIFAAWAQVPGPVSRVPRLV